MARRKPVPRDKQKYIPLNCALKSGLLSYLKDIGEKMGLQRTKLIDRIVAGTIRNDIELSGILKNLDDRQKKMLETLNSGHLRTAYTSLHKLTMPDFLAMRKEKQWSKSMLLERILLNYLLTPEAERFELTEPPVDFTPNNAKTYEELSQFIENPATIFREEMAKDKPETNNERAPKLKARQGKKVKFLFRMEKTFMVFFLNLARQIGRTRTDIVEEAFLDTEKSGMIFSGNIDSLNSNQKILYDSINGGEKDWTYVYIRKEAAEAFEKTKLLTGWEPMLLCKRILLTWLLSNWETLSQDIVKK